MALCELEKFLRVFSVSGNERSKRSAHKRKTRSADDIDDYKYLEAALIVPKTYVDKYGADKFDTVLLVIANLVRIRIRFTTST